MFRIQGLQRHHKCLLTVAVSPFFGTAAICTMKIDNFRRRPQKCKETWNWRLSQNKLSKIRRRPEISKHTQKRGQLKNEDDHKTGMTHRFKMISKIKNSVENDEDLNIPPSLKKKKYKKNAFPCYGHFFWSLYNMNYINMQKKLGKRKYKWNFAGVF